ncbi:unnamed protein product, partial [Prorocentrum cordatum]
SLLLKIVLPSCAWSRKMMPIKSSSSCVRSGRWRRRSAALRLTRPRRQTWRTLNLLLTVWAVVCVLSCSRLWWSRSAAPSRASYPRVMSNSSSTLSVAERRRRPSSPAPCGLSTASSARTSSSRRSILLTVLFSN